MSTVVVGKPGLTAANGKNWEPTLYFLQSSPSAAKQEDDAKKFTSRFSDNLTAIEQLFGLENHWQNYSPFFANPSISSISPSSPIATVGNQNVSVNGSNFVSGLTVTVTFPGGGTGTLSGSQIGGISSSSFTMAIDFNNVPGSYSIRVNNPGGVQSNTFGFTVQAAVPSISSISPSSPIATVGNQNVNVNGSKFVSGLTVTVTFPGGGTGTLSGSQIGGISSTSFTMAINFNNVPGSYSIRVNNPGGTQSNTFGFTVQPQPTAPSISSISPSSPIATVGNQNVNVNGSSFVSGLTVTVTFPGGGTGTLSGSQIGGISSSSFTMAIDFNNVPGGYCIKVNNPSGLQSNNFCFTVQTAIPSVSSISPSSPIATVGNQNVAVNGQRFVSGLTVTVTFPNGTTGTLSGSQIGGISSTSFTMAIDFNNVPGAYSIRVNNPGGAQSNTFGFTVQSQPSPTITSISPSSPIATVGNQNVNVNGSNFVSGLTVTVTFPGGGTGTLSGSQIGGISSTSFTMAVDFNNVPGSYSIRVNNPGGVQSNTFGFTVQPQAPSTTITSISPTSPTALNVDQNVVVNGTGFQQGLTVTVTFPSGGTGTLSGTQIQNVTATSFMMRVTLGASGAWSMRVNDPNGGESGSFGFNVLSGVQAPVIFSVNPTTPIVGATDQDVIVTGSNFQPNLQVPITFPAGGGTTLSGAQVQNVTATSFIMRATLSATGNWTIKVSNPDGGSSAVFPFTVGNGTNPTVSSISPPIPLTNGADQNVIVNGGNFQNGLKVNVTFPNGGVGTLQGTGQIQNVTATSFTMRITLNAAGSWTMRVLNPDNSQSGQFPFTVNPSAPPPTGLPTSVLSPVIGSLRVTTSNQAIADGKWEFDQHKTGFHRPGGGISLSDDTYAWDTNQYTSTNGDADKGQAVFATADGEVVKYVGTLPGAGPGAVLIAHPNASAPVWFSGYLHMTNVTVSVNQPVTSSTIIGQVGRTGADNNHLHFVVYSGQDTRGNLRSFDVPITERLPNGQNPPTVSSVVPNVLDQSSDPQPITIAGTNFDTNSLVIVEDHNGNRSFITPGAVTGFRGEGRILGATSTSITASVPFTADGNYSVSVMNSLAYSISATIGLAVRPSGRTPVIFIPGIMGSRLAKFQNGQIGNELWIGDAVTNHGVLKDNVEDPSNYRPISQRQVVATEVMRNAVTKDVYGKLLDYLTSTAKGAPGYTLYNERYPTVAPCHADQTNADLFVFPYDWRNSNWTSARDLYEFIQCIKSIRGNPSNFKVHIIAHSMGGLVARRYILNNPGNHHVERMVTLGTPWLGAPKFLNTLEFGDNLSGLANVEQALVILPTTIKDIAPSIRGAHELIPSRAYVDGLKLPVLGENGWNDFDFLPQQTTLTDFNFGLIKATMNSRYPPNNPGTADDTFHSQPGQDDWNGDTSGVSYYNFVGYGQNTVGTLVATTDRNNNHIFLPFYTSGDGTVPISSALRYRQNHPELPDYRGPIAREKGFPLDHGGLASDGLTFAYINCVVNVPNADACINSPGRSSSSAPEDFVDDPNYLLQIVGSPSVIISDSFGNTTDPLSTSIDEGVSTVKTDVTGDKSLSASFPLDQNYKATLKAPPTPFSIILTKSDGQTITQAIRYVDITLPANVLAQVQITPQGVTTLAYDSDGNGTFETQVNPTINVSGPQAQDVEPPQVSVNEAHSGGNSIISLVASDTGTGVQRIMYSLDGTTFQQYSAALTLNAVTTPTIYAFADDNVFNRSGLVTYNLTPASASVSISGHVFTSDGRPLRNAQVSIVNTRTGAIQSVTTGSFGDYQFNNVSTGDTYTINAVSKHYRFLPQSLSVNDNLTNIDFTGDE